MGRKQWGTAMPIRPFLPEQSFTPEAITVMSAVFERVCADMQLNDRADRMTEVVATRVIAIASNGSYADAEQLRAAVIASFKRGE
jgi:hypothetical protein